MLINIPLTLIPLIVYNIIAFGFIGSFPGDPWTSPVFTVEMISDARWTMVVGDLTIAVAILFLFFEILKATRTSSGSIIDHALSTVVFIIYLIEFLTVATAAHSVFFILTVISVTITSARRDFGWGGSNGGM